MLTCDNINLIYNDKLIFKDFSITIYPSAIVVLRGKNGSGKTSLLRILSSLHNPTSGNLLWENDDINSDKLVYRNMSNYIAHNKSIKGELSVFENIKFWAELSDNPELIFTAIHYFKLEQYVDTACQKLSAGFKQRVELTRLITKISNIWLLDEPENNLDIEGKNLLFNLIKTRSEQNGIVIMSSHNYIDLPNIIEINIDDYKIN